MAAFARFRPSLGMTFVSAIALAILLALGVWQLERKAWKEALIAKIDERAASAPMPLQDALALVAAMPATQRPQIEFRRVRISGQVAPVKPIDFAALEADDVRRALVPVTAEGATVFLDVRTHDGQPDLAGAANFDGAGVLRFPKPANSFTPANDPAKEQWFWPDLKAAAAARGLPEPAPFFLAVETSNGLANGSAKPVLTNNHLTYAFTWFGLAAALIGVYLAWHRKAGRL
jgi:surfeit locus 1 family protein